MNADGYSSTAGPRSLLSEGVGEGRGYECMAGWVKSKLGCRLGGLLHSHKRTSPSRSGLFGSRETLSVCVLGLCGDDPG